MKKSDYAQKMGLTEEAVDGWVSDEIPVEISDSHLYKITMVVAIPNYSTTFGNEHHITAMDFIFGSISNEPEITVLDIQETKLGLVEKE